MIQLVIQLNKKNAIFNRGRERSLILLYSSLNKKSPSYCRGSFLVVLEIVFQIDKLPIHASSPCWIATYIDEPLASLADVVLLDKPLVSLVYLPSSFQLLLGRSRYIVQDMLVQLVVYIYIKLKHERLAQKIPVACGKVNFLEQ